MEMDKRLKIAGMDIARWRIAMLLRQQGHLNLTDLATHSVRKLSTITKTVYRMRDDGLVDVVPSDRDGRMTMVSLTEKGLDTIDDIIDGTQRFLGRVFDGLTDAQVSKLNGALEQLFESLDG